MGAAGEGRGRARRDQVRIVLIWITGWMFV